MPMSAPMSVTPESPPRAIPLGKPGPFSWICAAGSALMIGIGLYFGHLASTGVYTTAQYHKLSALLDSSSELGAVFADDRFENLIGSFDTAVTELVGLDGMVLTGQFARTQNSIVRVKQLGTTSATELATALSNARSTASGIAEAEAQAGVIERLELQVVKDYKDAAFRFASLLGYRAKGSGDQNDVRSLSAGLNQSGFLAALPKIEGIPDGIKDLTQLLGFISPRRQNELQFEMAQKRSTLSKEISALRVAVGSTIESANRIGQRKTLIEEAKTSAEQLEQSQRRALSLQVRATLKDLLRPSLPPRVQFATDTVCDFLTCSRFG